MGIPMPFKTTAQTFIKLFQEKPKWKTLKFLSCASIRSQFVLFFFSFQWGRVECEGVLMRYLAGEQNKMAKIYLI